jgi:hypothetical protein
MSANLYVYALDFTTFSAVQGSRDAQLLKFIHAEKGKYMAAHDDYFRSWVQADPFLPLSKAVEQIIHGTIDVQATPRFQFEHAAVVIAASLGERLDTDFFLETNPELWDEVDEVIQTRVTAAALADPFLPGLAEVLDRGPLLQVPLDSSMRLGTGYLTYQEIMHIWTVVHHVDLDNEEGLAALSWPDEALEGAKVYRSWLEQATVKKCGLFFHC